MSKYIHLFIYIYIDIQGISISKCFKHLMNVLVVTEIGI